MHSTATGKLFAAFDRKLEAQALSGKLPRIAPATITGPALLEKELKRIRDQGYSKSAEESVEGIIGYAVPIHDGSGNIVAAIHASVLSKRATKAHEHSLLGAAKDCAAHEFISEVPEAYDTVVGEQGSTLSGGQRQRIAIAWACLGHVDIVAVAPGRIIVGDRTKLIQPLEASIVRKVLVELDPTIASADKTSVQEQIQAAASEVFRTESLQNMRLNTLLNTKQTNAISRDLRPDILSKNLLASVNVPNMGTIGHQTALTQPHSQLRSQLIAQMNSEWQDIRAKLAKLDAEAARHQAEVATVQASISKLQSTIPMAQTREADYKNRVGEGFISSHAIQDKTREHVELERDLATQRARLQEAQSALAETEHAKAAYRAEAQRQLNDRHALAQCKLEQLTAEHDKASQRE